MPFLFRKATLSYLQALFPTVGCNNPAVPRYCHCICMIMNSWISLCCLCTVNAEPLNDIWQYHRHTNDMLWKFCAMRVLPLAEPWWHYLYEWKLLEWISKNLCKFPLQPTSEKYISSKTRGQSTLLLFRRYWFIFAVCTFNISFSAVSLAGMKRGVEYRMEFDSVGVRC